MQVDGVEGCPATEIELGMEDGPVPHHLGGLGGGGPRRRRAVDGRGHEVVADLGMGQDREAAEDREVVHVEGAVAAPALGGDAVVAAIARPLDQRVEGREPARRVAARVLAVDFPQAQDVGAQALELRAQDGDARRQWWLEPRPVVEALQIEGGDAELHVPLDGACVFSLCAAALTQCNIQDLTPPPPARDGGNRRIGRPKLGSREFATDIGLGGRHKFRPTSCYAKSIQAARVSRATLIRSACFMARARS